MKLKEMPQGHFSARVNDTDIVLYLTDDLLPSDDSLQKLEYMAETFDIDKRIIGLPDLHFKDKNFVPSGMTIPLRGYFSPLLLGPNNDGMGALQFRIPGDGLSDVTIEKTDLIAAIVQPSEVSPRVHHPHHEHPALAELAL